MATSEPVLEVERSESFTNGFLLNLWDMKTRGESTDMTIIATNIPIRCHNVVMAAASEHFRALLKDPVKDATMRELELNFDEVYVQKIVEYCYTGKISIELSTAKSYLRIAEYFQLTALKSVIEEFVCGHVSPETCVEWYSTAKEFNLRALDEKIKVTIAANVRKMTDCVEFHKLPLRELKECIKLVEDANDALEACVSWVSSYALSRSKHFPELLTHIQLDQCSSQCVEKVLQAWKPIWPKYAEVQKALKPYASVVPRASARRRKLTMLLYGGFIPTTEVLNRKMWKIDFTAGTCELFGAMDHRAVKCLPGYCSTPENLFVIGGSKASSDDKYQPLPECYALSMQDLQWEKWPDVDEPIADVVAVRVDDHIYTFGGESSNKAVYRLNLKRRMWSRCPDMPLGNFNPIIVANRSKLYYIFNNHPDNEEFKTSNRVPMYCLDTTTLTWSPLTPLPVSIQNTFSARAVGVGGDIYLVGGLERLCARYSTHQNTWKILESPRVVHRAFAVVHMDGDIVLCGGYDEKDEIHDIIEVYNIVQDTWRVHSVRMPIGLGDHHCAVYDEEAHKIVL